MIATVELDRSGGEMHVATDPDGRRHLLADYLSRHRPAALTQGPPEDFAKELSLAQGQSQTLDFALMLFDPQLSEKLKQRVATELDDLLQSEGNREHALDVILSHPLSERADTATALSSTVSRRSARTHDFVNCIVESQERSQLVLNSWLTISSNTIVQQIGAEIVRGSLINGGVIRRLVLEGKTQADVKQMGGSVAIAAGQNVARIVTLLMNEYREKLPVGKRENTLLHLERLSSEDHNQPDALDAESHRSASIRQKQAVREVEEIARLYVNGDDAKAAKFKDELIARQSEEIDRSFLVKSLCNIASRCSSGGRPDIAAECLAFAADNPQGCDYRLFVQMGDLFKELHKYEAATDCLHKAEEHAANVEELNGVNRELARLLTARGDYPAALESFEKLSDIDTSLRSRTSMATVLRKMGRLDESRLIFESVATWPPKGSMIIHHQALAGLAEVNRQTGQYYKAIRKYDWLAGLPDLNQRSTKVYRSALCSLYKLTGQLLKSESNLRDLLSDHPFDSPIQLELANVLHLQGKTEAANEFFQNSQRYFLQTEVLAAKLYAAAMGVPFEPNTDSRQLGILPEFEGLHSCHSAMQKILSEDFEGVLKQPGIKHVFRLHRDFESVLRYHARRALDAVTSRVSHVSVNVIRKRGLQDLKEAVVAIDDGDLAAALEHEKRLCLLAA